MYDFSTLQLYKPEETPINIALESVIKWNTDVPQLQCVAILDKVSVEPCGIYLCKTTTKIIDVLPHAMIFCVFDFCNKIVFVVETDVTIH